MIPVPGQLKHIQDQTPRGCKSCPFLGGGSVVVYLFL